MKKIVSLLVLFTCVGIFSSVGHADEFGILSTSNFSRIVNAAKGGDNVVLADVGNFAKGYCYSVKNPDVAQPTVLVSLTQNIFGEKVTKMAFYFLQEDIQAVSADSAVARELTTYLEDDWRFWSAIEEGESQSLHFFYDIEDNGNLDARVEIVKKDGEFLLTYKNLIGQKLTFMGETFRSTRNQIIGACSF